MCPLWARVAWLEDQRPSLSSSTPPPALSSPASFVGPSAGPPSAAAPCTFLAERNVHQGPLVPAAAQEPEARPGPEAEPQAGKEAVAAGPAVTAVHFSPLLSILGHAGVWKSVECFRWNFSPEPGAPICITLRQLAVPTARRGRAGSLECEPGGLTF